MVRIANIFRTALPGCLCAAAALFAPPAWSQYPDRPVKIIVPFPPGGAADTFARMAGQKLAEAWGNRNPVTIENRPGAGGIIGTEATAKAAPDGSTFLMVTIGHAVNPFMYSRLPYDTRADLTPIAKIASVPSLVVVGPAFSGKTLRDLLTAARAKPNDIQFASSGIGTTSHVGAALLESMAGVDMLHVPYKGAAPALQDVMGGRVPMSVDIITSSLQLVKADKLRALAITSSRRSPQLPEVPTVAEAGIPGYEFVAWYMLIAPAKTPSAIIERVNADLRRIATQPDFRKRIDDAGGEAVSLSVKEANDYLDGEYTRWSKVIKDRNIKAD
ncbi:MAG: tripartite tricarboxylate transporter substrate binding protein [Burkholderiales bacterium]